MPSLQSLLAKGVNLEHYLSARGLVFSAGDADENDAVSAQTSFASTTPTLLIDVPTTHALIPLEVSLYPLTATETDVADIFIEKDNADRYNTGGTTETVYNDKGFTNNCTLRSGATANAGYGTMLFQGQQIADISEAATEIHPREVLWTPGRNLDIIHGAGAFLVFIVTGNASTWYWHVKWAEVPISWAN